MSSKSYTQSKGNSVYTYTPAHKLSSKQIQIYAMLLEWVQQARVFRKSCQIYFLMLKRLHNLLCYVLHTHEQGRALYERGNRLPACSSDRPNVLFPRGIRWKYSHRRWTWPVEYKVRKEAPHIPAFMGTLQESERKPLYFNITTWTVNIHETLFLRRPTTLQILQIIPG